VFRPIQKFVVSQATWRDDRNFATVVVALIFGPFFGIAFMSLSGHRIAAVIALLIWLPILAAFLVWLHNQGLARVLVTVGAIVIALLAILVVWLPPYVVA
jgi:multisubunit Na+/H+ antiporter MnhB subunit